MKPEPLREVGGRRLPHQIGSAKYDDDPYRGQRRRPWMCFRVGGTSLAFPAEAFIKFVGIVHVTMIEAGVLLDAQRDVLKTTVTAHDYTQLRNEISNGLEKIPEKYESGPLSNPIVILIVDQVDREELDAICVEFSDSCWFFRLERDEILEMMEDFEYDHLEKECEKLSAALRETEGLVESVAVWMPPDEKVSTFGKEKGVDDHDLEIDAHEMHLKEQKLKAASAKMRSHSSRNSSKMSSNTAPPGLPPPGLRAPSRSASSQVIPPPPGLGIQPPPGIPLERPPGLRTPLPSSSTTVSVFSDDVPSTSSASSRRREEPRDEEEEEEWNGDSILSHEDVMEALRFVPDPENPERGSPVKKHESDMSQYIKGDKLFNRFEHPFLSLTKNLDLLYVVNHAVSSRNKQIQGSSKNILNELFHRAFETKLKKKFLDRSFVTRKWSDDLISLFIELIMLYFNTARYQNGYMLTIDNFVGFSLKILMRMVDFQSSSWQDFYEKYKSCHTTELQRGGATEKELENIQKMVIHIEKWIVKARGDVQSSASSQVDSSQVDFDDHRRILAERRQEDSEFRRPYDDHSLHSSDFKSSSIDERSSESDHRFLKQRRTEEQQRRRQQERMEEEQRNEQEFYRQQRIRELQRAEEEEARRRLHPMGFQNGGGTVDEEDDDFPVLDISDDLEDGGPQPDPDLPTTNCDEKPKQPYKYTNCVEEDDYQPPYMKCERMEPPEDFRTFPSVPTLKDYVNPTEPYLRRIQELGIYRNAQHYLDVQFRLLREDLVSPMRDGLSIYTRNGTCKGKRLDGQPCSDISVFVIESVEGKQVTERDGAEMRIIFPARYDVEKLVENDREMKELGLVMLSCDRFETDFHLGHIQTSKLVYNGCLHFAVHEETAPFQPNKTYQMVQATSYLPMYKHVLENLKTISPFKPMPFERYIVHGKKDIYRPYFHRFEKNEEQIQEEKAKEKYFLELRSLALARRFMSGKAIPRGVDDDDDDYITINTKAPSKEEMDLEYCQLQEPIFRQLIGVDTKGSDHILIDKKWYRISRLLDEFHPKNMDESQRQAFCATFKHELSLIQGPPGTGKTHIGVQIVKTMLQNRSHWKMTEPILVVCYTNSGLDNFLERILMMIEDDEELSKDNGKPKMIRYGRKCESEFLKRRNIMRFDVHEQYRSTVSEAAQREQSKASGQRRKKADHLAVSSFTLHCSRTELLSYTVLHHVMHPNFQDEINNFAIEHIDTREQPLNADEALACWLLDRDFGRATKMQTKKAKKSKFQEIPEDSDEENDRQFLTVEGDEEENEKEMDLDDEQVLDRIFEKMNLSCSGKDIVTQLTPSAADEYYTKHPWIVAGDQRPHTVPLMGVKSKQTAGNCPVDENINKLVQEVKSMILSTPPLQQKELEDVKFIFSLARPKRWALYMHWCEEVRKMIVEILPQQISEYRAACKKMQEAMDRVDAEIMRMPMIIGATTTGCSRLRPILERVEPRILIVEEAAEVLEAHIVSAMISSVEHCVMIGDHKQLRPNPAVHELGTEYGMQISMFERLVERALPYSQLREQHRMNLMISNVIVKPGFYDNVLDAENVSEYPDVEGMATNLFLWSHAFREDTPDGISWMNKHELMMVVELVRHLLKQSYKPQDIVVLTTYAAQRNLFNREYPSMFGLPSQDQNLIQVHTVDSFQGRESKIAIVSLVRSHRGAPENTGIGFLAVANRICVALTRAQHGMYIIGNGAYLKNNSWLWNKLVAQLCHHNLVEYCIPLKCAAHGNISLVKDPTEFAEKSPEGGCLELCGIEKMCGHLCSRRCHPNVEYEHDQRCDYVCEKECPNPEFRHKCAKLCYEECGQCMRLVNLTLPCGHSVSTPCSRIRIAKCDQLCSQTLQCGHRCAARCGDPCIPSTECEEFVMLDLECGHSKPVKCGALMTGNFDGACNQRCENRMLTCNHQCAEYCGEPCTIECQEIVEVILPCRHQQKVVCSSYMPERLELIECETQVSKKLTPCGHTEPIQCGKEPTTDMCTRSCPKLIKDCGHLCGNRCGHCFLTQTHLCQQRCRETFECGHSCSAKCSDPCPPCKSFCSNNCEHQSCGGGEKDFGRECSMLCVMCISTCANKCIHRSCTMRCYEECNVKPCSEACTLKLKCGHACLGMCGEKCPTICGTCQRAEYLKCVNDKAAARVHRLIMIPKCHHIFPVELLDEHVKSLKEQNKKLTCISCNSSLIGILRYAKYQKKYFLDENMKKLKSRSGAIHQSTYDTRIRETISSIFEELQHVTGNMSNDQNSIIQKFRESAKELIKYAEEYRGKADQRWRLSYLCDIGQCFWAIARLVSMTSKQRIPRRKDIPPNLEGLFLRCFGDQFPFLKILEELKRVNDHFSEMFKTFMIGAVLPKLRHIVARMTLYQMMSALCYQLCLEKGDISDADARTLGTCCFDVTRSEEHRNFVAKLEIIETGLIKMAPKLTEGRKLSTWKMLKMPTL
ncbi:hypothetical protein CRE_20452 [Caenorhabditis remanei]|uniref:NF-X1-type domain-containing protein n=1 Tax=Caenorhabditis remanei TaxID=31234 RepID=E3N2S9_CAERE|nr:hypothetical protein CRE_20452 [Caenorhabditis remanei]